MSGKIYFFVYFNLKSSNETGFGSDQGLELHKRGTRAKVGKEMQSSFICFVFNSAKIAAYSPLVNVSVMSAHQCLLCY